MISAMFRLRLDHVTGLLSGQACRIAPAALALTALLAACGSGSGVTDESASASGSATTAAGGPSTGSAGQGGSGSTGSSAGPAGTTGSGGVPGAWCQPVPACDAPPPDPGAEADWRHSIESPIVVFSGSANHRGRDLFLNQGDDQWIIGKFAYGLADKDLKDEDVDIYLLRDCGASWEKLGTATTTEENEHATVEGVDDGGGRVYFQIPASSALGPGRHRVHLVVKGDLSTTDLFIEVVPPGTPVFVSDVDGTLTSSETAEFTKLLTGDLPDVHVDAAEAMKRLVQKGYHPLYLTARPEWLVGRTREFLDTYGFPPGIVHTTLTLTGHTGASAGVFKTNELAQLALKKMVPAFGFGNTDSDADAYDNAHIEPKELRFFYQFDDLLHSGSRIESYTELLGAFDALPTLCP